MFMPMKSVEKNGRLTRVSWIIESILVKDENGSEAIDPSKAGDIGTELVEAETEGRFVRFEITKCPGPVKAAFFDPYEQRFGPR